VGTLSKGFIQASIHKACVQNQLQYNCNSKADNKGDAPHVNFNLKIVTEEMGR
jgi:hypothetical protein